MEDRWFRLGDHGRYPALDFGFEMKHLNLVILALLVLVGCESRSASETATESVSGRLPSKALASVETNEPQWQQVDSDEWYDLFELRLSDNTSLICTAFHKTDAQLGIAIAFDIAVIADDRGFKFFTMAESSLTEIQTKAIERMLPDDRVLESYFEIELYKVKPDDSKHHVFDTTLMTQLREHENSEVY